jgi:hypothetical protein
LNYTHGNWPAQNRQVPLWKQPMYGGYEQF